MSHGTDIMHTIAWHKYYNNYLEEYNRGKLVESLLNHL